MCPGTLGFVSENHNCKIPIVNSDILISLMNLIQFFPLFPLPQTLLSGSIYYKLMQMFELSPSKVCVTHNSFHAPMELLANEKLFLMIMICLPHPDISHQASTVPWERFIVGDKSKRGQQRWRGKEKQWSGGSCLLFWLWWNHTQVKVGTGDV